MELHRVERAGEAADPAADAERLVDLRHAALPVSSRSFHRHHLDGPNRTSVGTGSAILTGLLVRVGDEVRGDDRVGVAEVADSRQHVAAAAASVADETDVPLYVVCRQDQALLAGARQILEHLPLARLAGEAVADEEVCPAIEGGADLQRTAALPHAGVQLFVPARADADRELLGRVQDGAGLLVVEDLDVRLDRLFVGRARMMLTWAPSLL